MARVTGLEPATFGVTGRHSNQLSYTRAIYDTLFTGPWLFCQAAKCVIEKYLKVIRIRFLILFLGLAKVGKKEGDKPIQKVACNYGDQCTIKQLSDQST